MALNPAVAAVERWYRARGLPPMIAVPMPLASNRAAHALDDHLAERGWATRRPALVMVADTEGSAGLEDLPPATELRMDAEPDDAWLGMYHYRGRELPGSAPGVLMSAPWQAFVSIRDRRGEPVAIARLSAGGGWAGITAVEVASAHRRRGLGAAITREACAQAASQGIRQVFLQVEAANTAARALYERAGFRYSHRYHYRV